MGSRGRQALTFNGPIGRNSSLPVWPGLEKTQKVRAMAEAARMGTSKMVTIKAARIIGERCERKTLRK